MYKIYFPLLVTLFAIAGCDKLAGSNKIREEHDPLVASGQVLMEQQRWDEAIDAFKQALENEPRMARPHLDLAVIYQQHKINYINAIYHYDRYLELRPDEEKAEFITQQKLKVAQALANTLINASPEVKKVVQERNQLIQTNQQLRQQLASLKNQTVSTPAPPVVKTSLVEKTERIRTSAKKAATQKHQIYHVISGDTLTKIAHKFYGTDNWDPIFKANQDTLNSPRDLRVGQTLVIPSV
ncbi:MAG TPA: LysM peptidoglycan-binding domain-containing protein, partial [Pontiella sp.]